MDPRITAEIQKLTFEIKRENDLVEKLIRDDVFNVLQNMADCIVVYYPIPSEASEDGCDGCHVVRTVKGVKKQLVFINTANTRERQAFSVAHELGHIWNVDGRLKQLLPEISFDVEDVINRFAAELLMPEDIFVKQAVAKLSKMSKGNMGTNDKERITMIDIIRVIVYLMNYFFAPFKSVVMRFDEVGIIIDSSTKDRLLKYKDSLYVDTIIQEEQYNRLGIKTYKKSIANLADKLDEIERRDLFSKNKIEAIRDKFELKDVREDKGMTDIVDITVPQGK